MNKLEVDLTEVKTRLAVAEASIKDIKEDISSIKSNTTWILRIILGTIIAALLGLIFKGTLYYQTKKTSFNYK
ncbi:hemolysin XhlA family protein [Heyndrickxia sporothermodurans]